MQTASKANGRANCIGIARYVRPTKIFILKLCLAETLQGLSKNFLAMLKSLLESFKDLSLFG